MMEREDRVSYYQRISYELLLLKYLDRAVDFLSFNPDRFITHMEAFLTILTPTLLAEVQGALNETEEAKALQVLNKYKKEEGRFKAKLTEEELEVIRRFLPKEVTNPEDIPALLFDINVRKAVELAYYQRMLQIIIAVLDAHNMLLRASEEFRGEVE